MNIKRIGFIGCGNIADAIITGMISSKKVSDNQIFILDINKENMEILKRRYLNINISNDINDILNSSDIIFLCIKPYILDKVLNEIRQSNHFKDLQTGIKVLISVCAGKTINNILESFENKDIYCIRVMPNITLSVCSGSWLYYENPNVNFEQNNYNCSKDIVELLKCCGTVHFIKEDIFSQCTTISGCGPGFFSNIIHHIIESSIRIGVPEELASELVLETIYGTSKMLLECSQEPLSLQKKVSTPGGSTQAGIDVLENENIFLIFEKCLKSSLNRCLELGESKS